MPLRFWYNPLNLSRIWSPVLIAVPRRSLSSQLGTLSSPSEFLWGHRPRVHDVYHWLPTSFPRFPRPLTSTYLPRSIGPQIAETLLKRIHGGADECATYMDDIHALGCRSIEWERGFCAAAPAVVLASTVLVWWR
jgi:hypothetical protein